MWVKVKKQSDSLVDNMVWRFRYGAASGIVFSVFFCRSIELKKNSYAEFFFSEDGSRLAVQFSKKRTSDDCYTCGADGGGKASTRISEYKTLFVACKAVIESNDRLKQIAKNGYALKPYKEGNHWVVDLIPCFEMQESPALTDIGIYRLIRSGTVVYIGQGRVKERIAQHRLNGYEFDLFSYSVTDDPVKWESYWIEKYKSENNGSLPLYNKVSGHGLERAN